jgi:futalosine hydrolase
MHLLIVSATEFEMGKTASWLNNHSISHNAPKPELLISGIGQLQTTYALLKSIHSRRPGFVIQAGIGGFPLAEEIGNVFAISSDRLADLGVLENDGFRSVFDLALDEPDRFPFHEGKLKNPYRFLLDWTGLPVREGVTVNEIKSAGSAGFQRIPVPVVESMEGAALHYVCLMEKIPFLQIRSVSNVLGDRDKSRWRLEEARENLHESLVLLIQKLEKADETLFRI